MQITRIFVEDKLVHIKYEHEVIFLFYYLVCLFHNIFADFRPAPEIFSIPVKGRVGYHLEILCKPNRDSLADLRDIVIRRARGPVSPILARIVRANSTARFELDTSRKGMDPQLSYENNVPVLSIKFSRALIRNAGTYICSFGFSSASIHMESRYNLTVSGVTYILFSYFLCHFETTLSTLSMLSTPLIIIRSKKIFSNN